MKDCRPTDTPMIPNLHLERAPDVVMEEFAKLKINYRRAVGSLSYLSSANRPELGYTVSALSQFLGKPGIQHWKSFMNVLGYLKGTPDFQLT
ncbi:hypothetical protein O181_005058 [Austropuccinia psidii MF-1]|uniref:Reverse transcriptase Ty1/copia-type domain-containing protein n=1 Tax=Austropuccinia psidii MF-1 TaxID=1389203 RepID=A0A9Q3BHT7_9BASI|nr:hypothetical protein [Austropuccinia psidii MF-1]